MAKPGRPRKNPLPAPLENASAGAPRNMLLTSAPNAAPIEVVKRKRGRPRKNPLVVELPAMASQLVDAMLIRPPVVVDAPKLLLEAGQTDTLVNRPKSAPKAASAVEITEEELISIRSPENLAGLLSKLIGTEQDEAFSKYQQSSREKISTLENDVELLRSKLSAKQQDIDSLVSQLLLEEDDGEEATTCLFDTLELLTGVRVIDYKVDEDMFFFDIRHADITKGVSENAVAIEYRLVINKQFSAAEVTYIPLFLYNLESAAVKEEQALKIQHALQVEKHLPEYMHEKFKFPLNNLLQFYNKLLIALRKSGKALEGS